VDQQYELPGMVVRAHTVPVPLHRGSDGGAAISLFVRELVHPDRRDDWISRALQDFRVVLMDQRGTGRSSRVTARRIAAFADPQAAAAQLLAFRADSIVADAEHVRTTLYGGRRRTGDVLDRLLTLRTR
jgi:proline iminopeptidase